MSTEQSEVDSPFIHLLRQVFLQEAVLWAQLDHPNILPFHGVYYLDDEHKRICLVSPWMENGHLRKYLQANASIPRKPLVCALAPNNLLMVDGQVHPLRYMISPAVYNIYIVRILFTVTLKQYVQHFLCCRTHPEYNTAQDNILVNGLGRACIADFGSSSIHAKGPLRPILIGTLRWTAPELLDEGTNWPNRASDVWALGCVCYEVQIPFSLVSACRRIDSWQN